MLVLPDFLEKDFVVSSSDGAESVASLDEILVEEEGVSVNLVQEHF